MKVLKFIGLCPALFFSIFSTVAYAMDITKAVIPAAGLGTRFLPFTKSVPKEMLPLVDKPAMQYIIEEGLGSGIDTFFTIANENKQAIAHYFSHIHSLEATLCERGKLHFIAEINKIIDSATFSYIPQLELLGLGHAVLQAKEAIGNEYFGVMLPDEIFFMDDPVLGQLIAVAKQYCANVIAVREVPKDKVSRYAAITIKKQLSDNVYEISDIIEKPSPEEAPSYFATCGRYVFSPTIFDSLSIIGPGSGGEIQLTDGIADLLKRGERVIAVNIIGEQPHDIGNPLGWLSANIYYALKKSKYSADIKALCEKLLAQS